MGSRKFLSKAAAFAVSAAIITSGLTLPANAATSSGVSTGVSTAVSQSLTVNAAALKATKGKKYATNGASNIRSGSSTKYKSLGVVKGGYTFTATGVAKNGWIKLTYKGKTAYISNKIVKPIAAVKTKTVKYKGPLNPVTKPSKNGKYVTNRAGMPESARWFTKNSKTSIRSSANGKILASGFPSGTVAWQTKSSGSSVRVNIGGMSGWVKKSELVRKSTRTTKWNKKYSSNTIRRMSNGNLNSSALVAISWDPGRNLLAGPAAGDLTKMNTAFKKKFGHNLEIDLTYRPRTVQNYLYKALGPRIAAVPGTSVHGKGFAIDFPESSPYSFSGSYYKWLKANSYKYGWNHRKNLEQYKSNGARNPYAESWHFEYVR